MLIKIRMNGFLQGVDAPESTAANAFLCDFCEEPFHLIQP